MYEESFGTFVLSFYKNAKQAVTVKTINVQDFYHSLSFLAKVKIYYTLCVLEGDDFFCTFNKVYNVSHPILSTGDSSRRASCQPRRLSQNWFAQFLTTRPAFFWCVRGVPWDGGLFRRRSIFFCNPTNRAAARLSVALSSMRKWHRHYGELRVETSASSNFTDWLYPPAAGCRRRVAIRNACRTHFRYYVENCYENFHSTFCLLL